ncbi:MAG TPA: hypothetical protein VGM86_33465 [Thermoanaerobaculia bacterium]|jgi:hypothetical protein
MARRSGPPSTIPAERAAFLLREVFEIDYDEVASAGPPPCAAR